VLKPDLVLVFDSHWFTTVEFVVTAAERRMGFFTSDELPRGMSSVPYDMPGNPDFARLIARSPTRPTTVGSRPLTMNISRSSTRRSTSCPSCKVMKPGASIGVCQTAESRDFATVARSWPKPWR